MAANPDRKKSPPTIIDIARHTGLSKSTVAMALKHSPLIKQETTERILQAARELGYVYNRSAASLRQKSSKVVGLIIHDLSNPFFVEMLIGAERVLLEAGYLTLMAHTAERPDIQSKVVNSMREHNAAGIIICPAAGTPDQLADEIRLHGMPLVVIMRPLDQANTDTIGCDNQTGMQLATQHLIDLGHRQIAFVGYQADSKVAQQRLSGYRQAMHHAGLEIRPEWILEVSINAAGGCAAVSRLNRLEVPPSAVVCYNDAVALSMLNELNRQGKRAGRDLAVVGFDDIAAAAQSSPSLTTMAVGPAQLGEIASRTLLSRIHGEHTAGQTRSYFVTPRLIVRESSGTARLPAQQN